MNPIIILGPTASGKTKLSIDLAKQLDAEIISADSMQVYREMDIGTAKPTKEERQGIPHRLIDIKNPDEEWTVSDFVEQTNNLTTEQPNKQFLIVGGTGLYLWTLLNGYSFPLAPADKTIRERLEKLSPATLYTQLSTIDPLAAQKIHPNNKKRIVRALEVYELTGKPISQQQKRGHSTSHIAPSTVIGLKLEREELYKRINARVDIMIEKGLIEEIKGLLDKNYSKKLPSMQGLGYKEVVEYLDGNWDKDKMIYELKKRTRHFARRQLTWFRRFEEAKWFASPVDTSLVLDYIDNI